MGDLVIDLLGPSFFLIGLIMRGVIMLSRDRDQAGSG